MDTNNDALTSREEFAAGISSEWSGFDRNPSAAYFTPWVIENLGSMDAMPNFMSFDSDFNGVITEDEFRRRLEQEFNRLDKDKNDSLTRPEMIIAFAAPQGQRSRGSGQEGGRERGGRGGQSGRPPKQPY